MSEGLRERVAAYLRAHHVMTLATHGSDGPWAAAVFYVSDGFALHFLSAPTTRHCRNLVQSPRISATIQEDCSDWREIRGVQLEGTATATRPDDAERVRHLYGEKFPVVGRIADAPAAIAAAFTRVRWYTVMPARLYFVDNAVGFGHRDEILLGPSE